MLTTTTGVEKDNNNDDSHSADDDYNNVIINEYKNDEKKPSVTEKTETIMIEDNDEKEVQDRISEELFPTLTMYNNETAPKSLATCPLCNKKFALSEIEAHADSCLTRQQTPFITLQNSIEIPNFIIDDIDENENNYLNINNTQEISTNTELVQSLKEKILTFQVQDGTININVRRGHEFEDFSKYFKKTWNQSKIGKRIIFTYLGEAGVDTGGVSREVYTGKLSQTIDIVYRYSL